MPKFDPETGTQPIQPIQPAPVQPSNAGRWVDVPPEKEYTVHDCCYPCCSGGGYQKIKLYKDEVALETTCPCPWPLLLPAVTGYGAPLFCSIYFLLAGTNSIVRKPYSKLNGVEIDHYSGPCCDCCCGQQVLHQGPLC